MKIVTTTYAPALTGIRAIAAWMVFIHHFNPFSENKAGVLIHHFFGEFHTGVSLFFTLSGLLITISYYEKILTNKISIRNYLLKRFYKIYPIFFIIITANFIYYQANDYFNQLPYHPLYYYLGGITLLKGFFEESANIFMGQTWSLTVEECFYLSAPILFWLIAKNKKNIFWATLTIITIGILLTMLFNRFPFFGLLGSYRFLFNYTFFGRVIEFSAGMYVGLLYIKQKKRETKGNWLTYIGLMNIFLCIAGISFFNDSQFYGDHHPIGILINNLILPTTGVSLFYYGILTENTFLSRMLSLPIFQWTGKSSYVFYLIHIGFICEWILSFNQNIILLFLVLNFISVIIYYGIENPLNSFLRKNGLTINRTT